MAAIVDTRYGKVQGSEEDGLQIFKGVPFAAPPVGPLRFAAPVPPVPPEPWTGVRDCTNFGGSAPQPPIMLPLPGMDVGPQDEDCLYLNVWTPAADGAKRPVLVWIHGGAFVIGSGSQTIYDGARLSKRGDVVVVTVNYRLGALGFLHMADLCPELGSVSNCGLRDQVAALEWVREHIGAFGGDADQVTIFGESAGGMSVGSLLGAPSAKGLFARAIPQSGAAHNLHNPGTATTAAQQLLDTLGTTPADAAGVLREISAEKLRDAQAQASLALGTRLGLLPFQPVVDGDWLPQPPLEAIRSGMSADVDVMIGTTRDEWKLFGFLDPSIQNLDAEGLARRLTDHGPDPAAMAETYRKAHEEEGLSTEAKEIFFAVETDRVFRIPANRLAEAQHPHGRPVFFYRYDWVAGFGDGMLGACHAVELPFVFGATGGEGADFFSATGPEAERMAEVTMDAWLAFAKTGDPSHAGLPDGRFEAWDPERRATMILGGETRQADDPAGAQRASWDGLL